jgi:hypothetical protein
MTVSKYQCFQDLYEYNSWQFIGGFTSSMPKDIGNIYYQVSENFRNLSVCGLDNDA